MLRIAVVPPRRDCSATIAALALAAGCAPGGSIFVQRPADRLSPTLRGQADWPVEIEVLDRRTSLPAALARLCEFDDSRAIVFEPGGLGGTELERLQRHVDVIAITCRPRFDDELAALIVWAGLEAARSRRGHRAVPVILPVDQLPRDAGDADLGVAARFRAIGERTVDVPPRLLPPTLPPLPRPVRDPLVGLRTGRPHPLVVQVGRRMYRGLEILAENPDIAWPAFEERWREVDAATPLSPLPRARYARLADDLASYAVAGGPDETELAGAPHIDDWGTNWRPATVLTGIVHGHPHIADGRPVVTSDLVTLDPRAGWARTLSRLYRLGAPHPPDVVTQPVTQH